MFTTEMPKNLSYDTGLCICYHERVQRQLRKSIKLTGAVEMKDKTTGEPQLRDCCWTAQALSDWTCQLHQCIQQIQTQPTDGKVAFRDGAQHWHHSLPTEVRGRGGLTPIRTDSKVISDTKFNNSPKKNNKLNSPPSVSLIMYTNTPVCKIHVDQNSTILKGKIPHNSASWQLQGITSVFLQTVMLLKKLNFKESLLTLLLPPHLFWH